MTNTVTIIREIRIRLEAKGISDANQLEELEDHYISSVEHKIKMGQEADEALYSTLKELDSIEFEYSPAVAHKTLAFAALFCLLSLIGLYFYLFVSVPSAASNNNTKSRLEAPQNWPIATPSKIITSEFGPRHHHLLKTKKHHSGIDIKASQGTPVLASNGGLILEAGYHQKYGNYIVLQHNDRFSTRYMHLSSLTIESCDIVVMGEQMGNVGSTGLSSGPHLHFEILDNGQAIDPMIFLQP